MTVHDHRDPAPIPGDAEKLRLHEAARFRAAAQHARRVIPGPLGELAHRELTAYAEFGYRFTADALITRLVAEILAIRAPGERDAA